MYVRDPGVVEQLIGQGDDAFEPVVLEDPAADLGLAGSGCAGEQRRTVEDDGEPDPPSRPASSCDHVLQEQERAVVDPREAAPKRPAKPSLVPRPYRVSTFFHSTPNGGLASM